MRPVKTKKFDGIYGAPKGLEAEIGGLPYYREIASDIGANEIFSVWEPSTIERAIIAAGGNILISQIGEPIRPMSVQTTDLKEVVDAKT